MSNSEIDKIFNSPKKESSKFSQYLSVVLLFTIAIGLYFSTVESLPAELIQKVRSIKTTFSLKEKKAPKPKKVKKTEPIKVKPKEKKVYDLTTKPKLNAKKDVVVIKRAPRKVYGVKKVYSKGLGSGGSMSDAVAGKLGNSVDTEFDTVTAIESDLVGKLVSAVTVTDAPKFKKRVKPKITKEIKENSVEGVIKVKVLVDIDGKVKKAFAKNDLGFGSKEAAIEACLQMEFSPAKRGEELVAVWIVIPVRFQKLG